MTIFSNAARTGVFALLCLVLTACNQTAVSGYDPKPSKSVTDQRKAKIEASRERARKAKAKRQKEFLAKREAARAEKRKSRAKKPSSRKKVAKKAKRKTVRKAAKKSNKRTNRKTRKVAKKSVSKKKRVKKKTAAFVGGRSRGIVKNAPWGCVPNRLKRVLDQVSRKYGRVIVNSTARSSRRNRMVGGKKRSYHLKCQAVDFRVKGNNRGLSRFLRNHPSVGGFKRYASGFYHIDTGPRRTW